MSCLPHSNPEPSTSGEVYVSRRWVFVPSPLPRRPRARPLEPPRQNPISLRFYLNSYAPHAKGVVLSRGVILASPIEDKASAVVVVIVVVVGDSRAIGVSREERESNRVLFISSASFDSSFDFDILSDVYFGIQKRMSICSDLSTVKRSFLEPTSGILCLADV